MALARALVREPDVFLLDEPLSNLDLELRAETRGELKALHQRVGGTTVHVTHDQVEALVLGDSIAVLREGRLEQVGTPDEVWHAPATTFVARFVGSPPMNLLPGDGPPFATTYLSLFVYRNAFEYLRYGYAAAATLVLLALTLVAVVLQRRLVRRAERVYSR